MIKRSTDGGRGKVLATARQLFAERGFHQTAMAELSERAGVSVGQIYRLYANKGEMIAAICGEDTAAKSARLDAILAEMQAGTVSPREALETMLRDTMQDHDEALIFEILAEGSRNGTVGCEVGDFCTNYRQRIGILLAANGGPAGGEKLVAAEELMMALLFGLAHRNMSRPTIGPEDMAVHVADMVLAMLAGIRAGA